MRNYLWVCQIIYGHQSARSCMLGAWHLAIGLTSWLSCKCMNMLLLGWYKGEQRRVGSWKQSVFNQLSAGAIYQSIVFCLVQKCRLFFSLFLRLNDFVVERSFKFQRGLTLGPTALFYDHHQPLTSVHETHDTPFIFFPNESIFSLTNPKPSCLDWIDLVVGSHVNVSSMSNRGSTCSLTYCTLPWKQMTLSKSIFFVVDNNRVSAFQPAYDVRRLHLVISTLRAGQCTDSLPWWGCFTHVPTRTQLMPIFCTKKYQGSRPNPWRQVLSEMRIYPYSSKILFLFTSRRVPQSQRFLRSLF